MKRLLVVLLSLTLLATVVGCSPTPAPTTAPTAAPAKPTTAPPAAPTQAATAQPTATAKPASPGILRLATTTSTYDTGLLDAILPSFEKANNVKVDVVAVGSGQAIEIGSKGDADVLLVHARAAEDKFVADGHAKARFDVMYNDFVIIGPNEDPAGIKGAKTSSDALSRLAAKN